MKKILSISILAISLLALPTIVLAQGNQQGQGGSQQRVQDPTPTTHDDTAVVSPQGDQQGQGAGTGNRGIDTAIQNLNRVAERNNNPEIGEQVRSMVQSHERVQVRTETALHQMSQRNQAIKLLIGPDYKNAGQVRSDVVGLRNDIGKLEQIKEDSLSADTGDVQGAIDGLQIEAEELETQLEERLSGFSLFGWLAKLFAN